RDLASGVSDFITALCLDTVCQLQPEQVRWPLDVWLECPVNLFVADRDLVDRVERAKNVLVRTKAERTKEDRAQEFALAVDSDVLEFHPRTAIGNDLAEEVSAVVGSLEEDAR